MTKEDEQNEEQEEIFFAKDFERKFFSENTNKVFVKTFMDNALRDPITGEIGKGIIFCVSRRHATKITQLLNEYADKMFPDKYCSDFAMQITSDVMNAQTYTINFQNNNLSGNTTFLDGYKSSKTRICVTVGMMTTGYDCEDLLNIGLLRPIFSPTDFIQIKGRGTRKARFIYREKVNGTVEEHKQWKTTFKLFDFFGNCEYFEEKFNYDEIIKLPHKASLGVIPNDSQPRQTDDYENFNPDPLASIKEAKIGLEGMKIDRAFFDKFEETVKKDETAKKQYEQGNYMAVISYIDANIMNKPTMYFTWDKLRKAIGIDRRISPREIIDKIFGTLSFFKSKSELVDDEFESFLLTNDVSPGEYWSIKQFFEAYLTDKDMRRAIEDKKYQLLGTEVGTYTMEDLKKLGKEKMTCIIDYVNDNINVSRFM